MSLPKHLTLNNYVRGLISLKKTKFNKSYSAIGMAFCLIGFLANAQAAEIAGSVTNSSSSPALPAHVSVVDQAGKIAGQADADSRGRYSIDGMSTGQYNITLTLPGTKYLGQTIQTGVRPEGLCLDWKVSETAAALATGRPGASLGTCTAAAWWGGSGLGLAEVLGLGAIGLGGATVGGLAAGGVFNGGSSGGPPPKPASPGI
jgi:hypothetical protein